MDLSGDEVDHHPHHYQHHHHHQQQQQHHQMAIPIIQETNPPLILPPYNNNNINNNNNNISMKKMKTVKYKECLKNHAASIGGNATDGCGEFMPSGEEGSLEALKCSACNCHRNFHRKEIEGMHDHSSSCSDHLHCYHTHHYNTTTNNNSKPRKGLLISQHQMIMPLGAIHSSDQSDHEMPMARPTMAMKKRFRTKFSPLQKEKMLDFANQVGWKLQKQEDSFVQQFCQEIGVKRRVLKVWMHNNKHNLAKKINTTCDDPPSSSSPPPLLNPPPPPPLLE
ncbi:Homeodomain ZF-HD class domain-containing protein [Dioscorea alata]|uniref:Homeodomain ZF-HD class domain-containing protein n=1 Tax=Dioscorea alata TaxID=55571 RepID=A0ACB7W1P2_DIOAL|nr:Homeodomain ZF-HD class domain-containing protein [Dioscorea alata]